MSRYEMFIRKEEKNWWSRFWWNISSPDCGTGDEMHLRFGGTLVGFDAFVISLLM
jgi:hypothetical protein